MQNQARLKPKDNKYAPIRRAKYLLLLFAMMEVAAICEAQTSTNKFSYFIDDSDSHAYIELLGGERVLRPEKIEEARHAQISQPASDDPDGNWGAITNGLQASIRFKQRVYGTNEPIVAVVLIRNLGEASRFWISDHGIQSDLAIFNPAHQKLERKDWLGTNTFKGKLQRMVQNPPLVSIGSGLQVKAELDLRQWFDLGVSGEYSVHSILEAPQIKDPKIEDMVISGDAKFLVAPVAKVDFPIELACRLAMDGGHLKANQPVELLITMKNVSTENLETSETDPLRDFRFVVTDVNGIMEPRIYPLLDKEMDHSKMAVLKPGESREFKVDLAKLYDFPSGFGCKVIARRVIWQGATKYGEAESSPIEIGVER